MKTFVIACFFAVACLGCKKESNHYSDYPASIQELINNNTNCTCEPAIDLYQWKEQKIYVYYIKGTTCNGIPLFYNEQGTKIEMEANYTYAQFGADAKIIKNIWECTTTK